MAHAYEIDAIRSAVNVAGDDVLDAIEAGDEGARDVVNLLINVFLTRLEPGNETLGVTDVIASNYDVQDPAEVLDWCAR